MHVIFPAGVFLSVYRSDGSPFNPKRAGRMLPL
jgi:hypothetical protein